MNIPDDVLAMMTEQMRQIQLQMRSVRAELEKYRQKPIESTIQCQTAPDEPPTEKQINFLKSLGVEDIPATKEAARQLLHELNEKRENGEYSIPPTAKQLKFLKGLKYAGELPESKEEAWKLIQDLTAIE